MACSLEYAANLNPDISNSLKKNEFTGLVHFFIFKNNSSVDLVCF